MAPTRENPMDSSYSKANIVQKPPRLSMKSLQRTISDISSELSTTTKEAIDDDANHLPTISEIEDAKCECCGMCEECTNEYINRVRNQFAGNLICGLCAEAVKVEMGKNGGKREEAVEEHMRDCVKFNRVDRVYPVLHQAEAIKEILKKSSRIRAKSASPRDNKSGQKINYRSIARSSSCIPAINRGDLSPKS